TDLPERFRPVAIARGGDRNQRDLDTVPAQPGCGELGLREREPTAAGADANQHGTTCVRQAVVRRGAVDGCARTRSAPAPGAASRSDPRSSTLVFQTEQVTHSVS